MPGILLNRLSRPKEGETPADQLSKGRSILLEQMLPAIAPAAEEGNDYLYLEDIQSRLKVHQQGEILHQAMQVMQAGRCQWLAVTEISRISGDLEAAGRVMRLCSEHRIKIYTAAKLRDPYEPWRAASRRQLNIEFMLANIEVENYRERTERAYDAAYTVATATTKTPTRTLSPGLGRHLNGQVPLGYLWDKAAKTVQRDESIPFPDYIPPGHDKPAALKMYEIVQRGRELGLTYGSPEASHILAEETGLTISPSGLVALWNNPFFAGRPTSRYMSRGGRSVARPREEQMSTEGKYTALCTWEEHQALLAAIADRDVTNPKTNSTAWATGLVLCACGQPYISAGREHYGCRGNIRKIALTYHAKRQERGLISADRHQPIPDWEETPTCGDISKEKVHNHISQLLQQILSSPSLTLRLADYQTQRSAAQSDAQELERETAELLEALRKCNGRIENAENLAIDGDITPIRLREVKAQCEKERAALNARLERLDAARQTPPLISATVLLLRQILAQDFAALWYAPDILTDAERALIARACIVSIPVKGRHRCRYFEAPTLAPWLS